MPVLSVAASSSGPLSLRTDAPIVWLERGQLLFLRSLLNPNRLTDRPTQFESLLLQWTPVTHVVSATYGILLDLVSPSAQPFIQGWAAELQTSFTDGDRDRAFLLTHTCSIASYAQEKNYKVLTRWYCCPVTLHFLNSSIADVCWRCQDSRGTMFHIWWDCPLIEPFWHSVNTEYNKIESSLVLTPKMVLLSMLPGSLKAVKRGLLRHCLVAARTVIPRHWRSPTPPSLAKWLVEMDRISDMERLLAEENCSWDTYHRTWLAWTSYRNGSSLQSLSPNAA